MANIIEIVVTATDLASPTLGRFLRDWQKLRDIKKEDAQATGELDRKTKDLLSTYKGGARDVEEFADQFKLFDESLDAANLEAALRRRDIALKEYERGLKRTGKSAQDAAEQLSFFEKTGNALGGQFRQTQAPRRFVADFQERERPLERVGDDLVPVIRQVETLTDHLENADDAVNQLTIDFEDGSRQMSFGDLNAELFDTENRLRSIQQVSSRGGFFSDFNTRELEASIDRVIEGLEEERAAFIDVGDANRTAHVGNRIAQLEQIKLLGLTAEQLERYRDTIPAVGRALDDYNSRTNRFNTEAEETSERLRVLGERLQSERGVLGGLRRLGREAERNFFEKLSGGVKKFGVDAGEADEAFERFQRNFINLSNVDETIGIGFTRIARFMAVIIAALPFATTLFGVFAGAVVGAAGGVVALGSAIGTLAGLLATLPGLLTAVGAGLGSAFAVFGPEVGKLLDRVKEIENQKDQARKNTTRNNEEVRNAEENIADIRLRNAEQVENAEQGIREARLQGAQQIQAIEENIADTKRRNERQERNAVESLNDLRRRNAREQADIQKDISEERRKVEDDVRKAQERLADLQKRNAEQERKLTEDITAARSELAGLRAEGASPFSISNASARLANTEATLRKFQFGKEKREEKDAESDLAKLRRDSGERLIELQERLRRAKADGAREESRAIRNLNELRTDNTRQLIQLEQQLVRARETNARNIARLERELGRVRRTNIQQIRDAEERLVASRRRAAGEVGDPFEGLSDSEANIVRTIGRIKESFESLTAGPRNRFIAFMEQFLNFIDQRMPRITETVNKFADAFLRVADNAFSTFFKNGQNVEIINHLLEDGLVIFEQFGNALVTVAEAMLKVADAARPLTQGIGNLVESGAEQFASLIEGASVKRGGGGGRGGASGEATSEMDKFFAATARVAGILGRTFKNLGNSLIDIAKIAEPFGEILLESFEKFTASVEDWTSSPQGRTAIKDFFEDAIPVTIELARTAGALVETFFRIGRALIRPGGAGEESFIVSTLESIQKALPAFEKFVVESTEKNGPKIFKFFGEMIDIIGELVGPGGAFTVAIDVIGQVLHAFNQLPEPIRKFIVVFVALGGPIGTIITRFIALRKILVGFAQSGTLAVLMGGKFKVLLVILVAFPGVLGAINKALSLVIDAMNLVLAPIDKLGEALGVGGGLSQALIGLTLVSKRFRAALLSSVQTLTVFMARMAAAAVIAGFAKAVRLLVAAFYAVRAATIAWGIALTATGIGAIAVAIGLIIVAIVELERRFHVFSRFSRFVREQIDRLVDYLRNHWKRALVMLFLAPFVAIPALLFVAAKKLGPAIIDGVVAGLKGLGNALLQPFKDAWGDVKGFFKIFSPSGLAKDELGVPIAQGAMEGASEGIKGFGEKFGTELAAELDIALAKVEGNMDATIDRLQSKVSGISTQLSAGIDAKGRELTPSEKKLAALDVADQNRERAQRRQQADNDVREAQRARDVTLKRIARLQGTGGTVTAANAPEARAAAFRNRQALAEARAELRTQNAALRTAQGARAQTLEEIAREELRARLERQAENERIARDKAIEAEKKTVQARFNAIVNEINKAIKEKDAGALGKARQKLINFLADQGIAVQGGKVITQGLSQGLVTNIEGLLTNVRVVKGQIVRALTLTNAQKKAIQDSWKFSMDFRVKGSGRDFKISGNFPDRHDVGGVVRGSTGQAVPIIAHAGEWVLNAQQQMAAARMVGTSPATLQAALFSRTAAARGRFAQGGVVTGADKSTVNQSVTIHTTSPNVDIDYVSRVLERRMRSLP